MALRDSPPSPSIPPPIPPPTGGIPSTLTAIAHRQHGLIATRDVSRVGADAALRTAITEGAVVQLRRGVYIATVAWRSLTPDQQYMMRIRAVAVTHTSPVFAGYSAAAVWGLPVIGHWPSQVFILSPNNVGGRTRTGVVEQTYRGDAGIAVRDDIALTSAARTVLDVSRVAPFTCSVAMADAALHVARSGHATPLTMRAELQQQFDALAPFRGSRRCRAALGFADGLSGSAGESLSRVNIHLMGFPPPILQHAFYDSKGFIGFADFWWPEFGTIGEFDGKGKYMRKELLGGEAPADAVYREKLREDRMRAVVKRFVRWDWNDAWTFQPLKAKLVAAGLRPTR